MLYYLLFGAGRTVTYTVHEGATPPTDRIDRADALVFIKDGFSFPAFVAAPAWLAGHRLWLGLLGYAAIVVAVLSANAWLGLPMVPSIAAIVALHLFVGFEADTVERLSLETKGWSTLGSVTGTSALDCERRFFETWLQSQPIFTPRKDAPSSRAPMPTAPSTVTGAASANSGRAAAAGSLARLFKRSS